MSKAITQRILVIFILFIGVRLNAQQWLGRTTGNYTGTYGLYNNASSIADSKYKYYLNFWGRGVNFYNNYLFYNAPIKLNQWANGTYDPMYQGANGKPDFQKDWLLEDLNGKNKQFSYNQDIWGPSFMFPLSQKVNMSINTRQRNSLQMFGISEPMARFAYNGIDSSGGVYDGANGLHRNQFYSNGKFGANAQSNQEISFSVAGVLAKNDHHQLSGGASVKFIRGLGAAYFKGEGFDMAVTGNNSVQIANADLQYAYTDDKSVVKPFNNPYGLFSLASRGRGAGVDLGLTYTYTAQRGKYTSNKYCNCNDNKSDYDIKLAAAFNDIGNVRYTQGANKYTYNNSGIANINVPSNVLNGFNNPNENAFDTIGKYVFDQIGATKSHTFNSSLPTAFNFQADFRFSQHFYTAVYLNQSLKSINSTGMRSTSMLSIIPRFESRAFEFSMPLTLGENYKNFTMGAYMRVGPVFFGSDNLGGLLNVASNSQYKGADIYGGVAIGIGHCDRIWYENKVEPNRIDTVKQKDTILKKDTIRTEKKDTVEIIKRDTVKIKLHDTIYKNIKGQPIRKTVHDTVYIEKIIKTTEVIQKENEIKNREAIIIIRQRELDQREKDIRAKEAGTFNENEALKKCKDQTIIVLTDNTTLKNKVTVQENEIIRLQKQIDSLNKNKSLNDAEILKAKKDKAKSDNDARLAAKKADSLQAKLNGIAIELDNCKKNNSSLNNAEIVKSKTAKAENDARLATKKADSLQAKLDLVTIDLSNCRKSNGSRNEAEIVKARIEKAVAENDARIARRKADSLQARLDVITLDLSNCKTNNGSKNEAEIVKAKSKAEKDAKIAQDKADSLQTKIDIIIIELDNCKKNSSTNDANIVKLKKAEEDKTLYKAELDALNKTNLALNAKIYKRDATIDSLLLALAGCGGGDNNNENYAALVKKCNDEKGIMAAEINDLKGRIINANHLIDSTTIVVANLRKDKSANEAQIVDLNKQLNKLTTDMIQLREEYQFVRLQNKRCGERLDSCINGLLENQEPRQTPPGDNNGINNGTGGGGPMDNTSSGVEFKFDNTTYDFGYIPEGQVVSTAFLMTNTGTKPVSILSDETSWGCGTPVYSKEPVQPGQSTIVKVSFYSVGKSGYQNKTIILTTTGRKEILTIKGVVTDQAKEATVNKNDQGTNGSTTTTKSGPTLGGLILRTIINAAATSTSSPSNSGSSGSGKSGGSSGSSSGSGSGSSSGSGSGSTKTHTESGSSSSGSTSGTRSGGSNTGSSTRRR